MKKWIPFFILLITLIGCSDDSDMVADSYYVKYVVDGTKVQKLPLEVSVKSKSNTNLDFEIDQSDIHWEKVIGPVRKGFEASMEVSNPSGKQIIHSEIYVKKNNGAYLLKVRDDRYEWRSNLEIDYTIDF